MTTLYEITESMRDLVSLDFNPDEIADTLDGLQLEFKDKANNIIALDECLKGDVVAINDAIKRLQDRKAAIASRQESLKEYLLTNMIGSDIKKIECPLFTASVRKGVDHVVIDDLDSLADEFVSVKTVVSASKVEIKKAIKAGSKVDGAHLETGKSSLIIK